MAQLDEVELRKTFRVRLKTVATLPAEKYRSWENRRFKPPAPDTKQLWLREHISILSERRSSSGFIEAVGETQYSIHTPEGVGTNAADVLAKAVVEAFTPGQSLTGTGLTVILERAERSPYRSDPSNPEWMFKTVAMRWRTFTAVT